MWGLRKRSLAFWKYVNRNYEQPFFSLHGQHLSAVSENEDNIDKCVKGAYGNFL